METICMKCWILFSGKNKENTCVINLLSADFAHRVVKVKTGIIMFLVLTFVLLNPDMPCLCKQCRSRSVGQLSGSALFVIKFENLYQQPVLSNLIGWKLEVGRATQFTQHDKVIRCRMYIWVQQIYKSKYTLVKVVANWNQLQSETGWLNR